MDYLKAACKHLGIVAAQVKKHRIEGDNFVVVADMGIKGCPKHIIPLSDLHEPGPQNAAIDVVEPPRVERRYKANATAGAKRQAARDNIDLVEVAQAVKGARITVHTLNEFVKESS